MRGATRAAMQAARPASRLTAGLPVRKMSSMSSHPIFRAMTAAPSAAVVVAAPTVSSSISFPSVNSSMIITVASSPIVGEAFEGPEATATGRVLSELTAVNGMGNKLASVATPVVDAYELSIADPGT